MDRTHFWLPGWKEDEPFLKGQLGPSCRAEGWNGNTLEGRLVDFAPDQGHLLIRPQSDSPVLTLKLNQIKRLRVEFEDGDEALNPGFELDSKTFVVHLKDGALFSGVAGAHRKWPHGLWVFPRPSANTPAERIFLPLMGITRFEFRSHETPISERDFNDTVAADPVDFALDTWVPVNAVTVENPQQLHDALERQSRLMPVPLGEALLGLGKITPEQLTQTLQRQRSERKEPLGQMLLEMGLVTPADLQTAFARKMGYPFVDVKQFPVDVKALRRIPMPLAVRLKCLPLLLTSSGLVVAMPDPLQFKVIEELEFTAQLKVIPVVSNSEDLLQRIAKSYREIGQADTEPLTRVTESHDELSRTDTGGDAWQLAVELSGEAPTDSDVDPVVEQSDNTLVKLINSMITEAYHQRASDIHIEPYPGREHLQIRFRVDGELRPYLELPASYRNALIARIKIMCDLDISERRRPQDGKLNFSKFGGVPIELRVATIPTVSGLEDVVMRLLTTYRPFALNDLRLSPENLRRYEWTLQKPHGLFLCVGPTGSGKTTTLHAGLQRLNQPHKKIWTAEDPVEITQRGLRQIQVNPKIGWTFSSALRALLRADPDVIMVGEVRDRETAEIAIEASLTGHLVFSTLHTNSAAETIIRLIDLGVDPFSFADSLQGILAQRLVRKLCTDCTQVTPLPDSVLDEWAADFLAAMPQSALTLDDVKHQWRTTFGRNGVLEMHTAHGCERCGHTGFRGRLALHEFLLNSAELRYLTQRRAHPAELQQQAVREGMRTLRQDGIEKVLQGWTSMAEVRSSASS